MPTDVQVLQGLTNALRVAGAAVSGTLDPRTNPCLLQVDNRTLRIYSRRLTDRQGAKRPPDELHMQMTFDDSSGTGSCELSMDSTSDTLLLGFIEMNGVRVYAAFNPSKHRQYGYSKSLQTRRSKAEEALQAGIAYMERTNGEIVVLFREDYFPAYLEIMNQVHEVRILDSTAVLQMAVGAVPLSMSARERRRFEVSRLLRDASFRRRVLHAYDACAVCGLKVTLQAAHIVPVTDPYSTDDIERVFDES